MATLMGGRGHTGFGGGAAGSVMKRGARQLEQAAKVQGALDSLARKTGRLAAAGNQNAQQIVDALRKQGINVDPDAPPATPPPP